MWKLRWAGPLWELRKEDSAVPNLLRAHEPPQLTSGFFRRAAEAFMFHVLIVEIAA